MAADDDFDLGDGDGRKWSVQSDRVVYDNRWIRVTEFQTRAPTGAPALYGLVHIKNLALGVLPVDENGCTIMVGQERFAFGRLSWELPEGGGPRDVPPLASAQRELSEEAGLKAANWLPLLTDVHLSNSVTDEVAHAFIAWDLSPDTSHTADDVEALTVRRVPYPKALEMAVSGKITDAFTLVMLFKADHLLRTGALPGDLARLMLRGA